MKRTSPILIFLLLLGGICHAQKLDMEEMTYYQNRLESGLSIKKTGASMMAPGAVIFITGIIMIASASYDRDDTSMLEINDPNTGLGIALVLNGLPLTAIGGIMTLAGNSKAKGAQRQLDRISLGYYNRQGQQGIGLTYRF